MLEMIAKGDTTIGTTLTRSPQRAFGVLLSAYAVGGMLVAAGTLVDLVSSVDAPGWMPNLAVALGITVAAFALYGLHDALFNWLGIGPEFFWGKSDPEQSAGPQYRVLDQGVAAGAGLFLYLGVANGLLILAVSVSSPFWALVGSWLAGLGLGAWTAAMRHAFESERGYPSRWTVRGVVTIAVAVAVAVWQLRVDWVLVVATLVAFLGLSAMSLGLLVLGEKAAEVWSAVGLAVIGTSAVAVVVLLILGAPLVAFLPSVALFAIGFIPLSNGAPILVADSSLWRIATAVLLGTGVGAIAALSFSSGDWPLGWALAVVLLTALLTAALVAEVFELAVILVLGAVLTAVLAVQSESRPLDPHPEAVERLVVLGDSYISGEGARRFFPDTNVAGEGECRRAATSYPYLVADELGYGLDFLACSGAKTFEIVPGAAGAIGSPTQTQLEQFIEAEEAARQAGEQPRPVAAVLVSAGGNDAWFGTVGQACLGPGSCDVHRDTLLRNVNAIGNRLGDVYTGVKEAVGDHVPVVAMPYPLILTEAGCDDSPLTPQEHKFLFEFTEVLNERARVEAAEAGIHWFAPGIIAFVGHRICDVPVPQEIGTADSAQPNEDDGLAVNVIDILPQQGALADRLLPTNWVHGSAHPNEIGHRRTAAVLRDWLADVIESAQGAVSGDPDAEEGPSANPQPRYVANRQPPPRPTVVSTRSLGIPAGIGCAVEDLPVSVQVKPALLGSQHEFDRLFPGSVVCHRSSDGRWQTTELVSEAGTLTIPGWGREVALDFDANRLSPRQVILWQRGSNEDWQVEVFEYCELDPACPDSEDEINEWMASQIGQRINSGTLPVLFMFLGAWFLAIEIKRNAIKARAAATAQR